MKCLNCNSNWTVKNRQRKGRQCYKCKQYGRQFLESYRPWQYSTDVHHIIIMGWVKEAGLKLPDVPESEDKPEIIDLDELQTFVGIKRHKIW